MVCTKKPLAADIPEQASIQVLTKHNSPQNASSLGEDWGKQTIGRKLSIHICLICRTCHNCAGSMLVWYSINTMHLPLPKTCSISKPGVYMIPCVLVRWAARLKNKRWSTRGTSGSTIRLALHWQSIQSTRSTECTLKTSCPTTPAELSEKLYNSTYMTTLMELSCARKIVHIVKQHNWCHKHTLPTDPMPGPKTATASWRGCLPSKDNPLTYPTFLSTPITLLRHMLLHSCSFSSPPKPTINPWCNFLTTQPRP
jgi:hypothetical protein